LIIAGFSSWIELTHSGLFHLTVAQWQADKFCLIPQAAPEAIIAKI
jgi:hypothetical protein